MSEPMSEKRLAEMLRLYPDDEIGDLVAEVRRLRERERVLHEVLRRVSIRPDLSSGGEAIQCDCCIQWWRVCASERHAPGCLAAPIEPA